MDANAIQKMSYRELQAEAKSLGIKANGTKQDLVDRILAAGTPITPPAQIGITSPSESTAVEVEPTVEKEEEEVAAAVEADEEAYEEVEAKNMAADFKTEASAEVSDIFSELKDLVEEQSSTADVEGEAVDTENLLKSPVGSRLPKYTGKKTYFVSPTTTPKAVSKWTYEDYDKVPTPNPGKRNALTAVNH
jgi:hypothetical protein